METTKQFPKTIVLIENSDELKTNNTNNENAAANNNNNLKNLSILSKNLHEGKTGGTNRKHKRFLSQQQQRKNNKNWKLHKNKRQRNQQETVEPDAISYSSEYDKNNKKFRSMVKFKNSRIRQAFPVLSKFFLPEKGPRKDLIVPPTKFLLGGNISDPLNLNSLQNEANTTATPKSSPITTPPKIEVIIPPNIHDPLHLLDPVDAIEYQKQLSSPMKGRKKTKHRNRKRNKLPNQKHNKTDSLEVKERKEEEEEVNTKQNSDENVVTLKSPDICKPVELVEETATLTDRNKAVKNLKLELTDMGRKRKISETFNSGKIKIRRTDSMDKIVSPVVPQPGAWKRLPRTIPNVIRNRNRSYSTSIAENISEDDQIENDIITVEAKEEKNDEANTLNLNCQKLPTFKNEDARYQYGNYDRYNHYRHLNEFIDVRLKVFFRNPHLFREKDILDIGCNAGNITIAIGKSLEPKSITGIDIDPKLIEKARKNLSMIVKIPSLPFNTESVKERIELSSFSNKNKKKRNAKEQLLKNESIISNRKLDYFPISFPVCFGPIPTINLPNDESANVPKLFPKNIFFKTANYVLKDESLLSCDNQQYDLILCLSVTKWIHLNFGDIGVKLSFKRIFNQLRPGGKLILEAQNWASYKKKKKLTGTVYNNFKNIEFYPNKFHEYLLSSEVGFSHSYPLGVPRHLSKGFRRPILLYVKGDFTPSHIRWSDTYRPQTPFEPYRGIYADTEEQQSRSVRNLIWGPDSQYQNCGNYGYRFTPSQQLSSTSQYYNPFETDSYLPSYDSKIQKRQYCFASPLYSPPSGRTSLSQTPVNTNLRDDEFTGQHFPHVYPPISANLDIEKYFNRTSDYEKPESENDMPVNNCDYRVSPHNEFNSDQHNILQRPIIDSTESLEKSFKSD